MTRSLLSRGRIDLCLDTGHEMPIEEAHTRADLQPGFQGISNTPAMDLESTLDHYQQTNAHPSARSFLPREPQRTVVGPVTSGPSHGPDVPHDFGNGGHAISDQLQTFLTQRPHPVLDGTLANVVATGTGDHHRPDVVGQLE